MTLKEPNVSGFFSGGTFSTLFLLLVISHGTYVQYVVAGSVVMTMVVLGLALIEDISYYKLDYRIQDIFVASPVSQFSFMMGLALSELVFGLPAISILFFYLFILAHLSLHYQLLFALRF